MMTIVAIVTLVFLLIYVGLKIQKVRRRLALALLDLHPKGLRGAEIVELSDGEIPPGIVYVILRDLERDGLVVSQYANTVTVGERSYHRRRYRLSPPEEAE